MTHNLCLHQPHNHTQLRVGGRTHVSSKHLGPRICSIACVPCKLHHPARRDQRRGDHDWTCYSSTNGLT